MSGILTAKRKAEFNELLHRAIKTDRRQGAFKFSKEKFYALYRVLITSPEELTVSDLVTADTGLKPNVLGSEDLARFISVAEPTGLVSVKYEIPDKLREVYSDDFRKLELTNMGLLCYETITGDTESEYFLTRKLHKVLSDIPGVTYLENNRYDVTVEDKNFTELARIEVIFSGEISKGVPGVYRKLFESIYLAGKRYGELQVLTTGSPEPVTGQRETDFFVLPNLGDVIGKAKEEVYGERERKILESLGSDKPFTFYGVANNESIQDPDFFDKVKEFLVSEEGEETPGEFNPFALAEFNLKILIYSVGQEIKVPGKDMWRIFEDCIKPGTIFVSEEDFRVKLIELVKGQDNK